MKRDKASMKRGQASITTIEAGLGVLLVLSVTLVFGLGVPGPEDQRTQAQLDTYASDAATLLASDPPRHGDQTRLAELTGDLDRQRDELEHRIDRILPDNVMFRVETGGETVGQPLPEPVPTGEASLLTTDGVVTLRVWYA